MRWVVLVALLAVTGCGASGGVVRPGEPVEARGDEAATLAAALPVGANRCAVSRPGRLPQNRRALFVRLSQGDLLPWVPDAPVVVFASADRVGPDGRRSSVALVRTSLDPATVRRWLETHAPLRIRFDGSPAGDEPDGQRAFSARFIDSHTLRLQLGPWPVTSSDGPGAEARCVALARSFPEAAEVASRHGEVLVLGASAHLPHRTDVVIVTDAAAVTVTRDVLMATAQQAEDRRLERAETEPLTLSVMGDLYPDRVEHTRSGRVLSSRLRILWEDLFLAAQDQQRMAAAIVEDERRHHPQPAESIDLGTLSNVRRQVALWTQRVASSRGAARRASAEQLRVLLERAVVAHAAELELARQLTRLWIDELEDGAAAVAVADTVLARGPSDAEGWRSLRREAHAVSGRDALARALAEDGVVDGASSERAATDLSALRRQGVDYEFAEGAWLAAQAVESRADRLRMRDVAPARLPVDSFAETIGELADLASRRNGPAALYVLARGDRSDQRLLWNPDTSPVVEVRDASGAPRLIGVASTGDPRVRAMGRAIADGLLLGPIELAVFVVPIGGSQTRPELVLRIAGELESDAFVIDRASGGAARVDWRAVTRLLAEPLAALEPRVFPPPELEVDVADERDGRRLVELAAEHGAVECTRVAHRVRCSSAPEAPGAAREVLRRFAADRLAHAARALVQP